MTRSTPLHDERHVDRLRELASVGAGHAAGALAQLLGRTIWMSVPVVHGVQEHTLPAEARATADNGSAVFFELRGGIEGMVAVIFPAGAIALLVDRLMGGREGERSDRTVESALCEVGNIVVSHHVSAIADTLSTAIVPSVPRLAEQPVPAALACELTARHPRPGDLLIETELRDAAGELCSYLVLTSGGC